MTSSLDSHFCDILRVSPACGFGFTFWILPHPYTTGLGMGVSNPSDNKTCVHLEDQTCHHWDRKNDSERLPVLVHSLRNRVGRSAGSLELNLCPLGELDSKLFRKWINVFLLFSLDDLINPTVSLPRENIYTTYDLRRFSLLCMCSNLNFLNPTFDLPIIHSRRSFKSNLRFAEFIRDCGDFVLPLFI